MKAALQKLITRSPQTELDNAAQAEAAGRQALATAELVLAASESTYGDRLVDAGEDHGKIRAIEGEHAEAQRAVDRLRTTHAALVARHELAKAAVDRQDQDERFAETERRLKDFRIAAEKMVELARAAGAAQREAEDAVEAAYVALPVKTVVGMGGCADGPVYMPFKDLSGHVSMLIASAAQPPGVTRTSCWDYAQQPSLLQQIDSLTNEWMSLRHQPQSPKAA